MSFDAPMDGAREGWALDAYRLEPTSKAFEHYESPGEALVSARTAREGDLARWREEGFRIIPLYRACSETRAQTEGV